MLNRIVLIGRLTRDPELRYTPSGTGVCSFTLAVDRRFKSADGTRETDFVNIVAWRQLGELCANYLSKGKMAAVEGRLQIRNYTDKEGNKRTAAEVVADDVNFLSPKDASATGTSYAANDFGSDDNVAEVPLTDDDLPF